MPAVQSLSGQQLIGIWLVIPVILLESDGTVRNMICGVGDSLPGDVSSSAPGTSAYGSSHQAQVFIRCMTFILV